MKNLINYLSKKSLSLGNGSRLVRDRFEIGSAKSRKSIGSNLSRFCLASLICLCMLTVGVGNVWGQAAVNTVLWGENFAHFGTKTPSAAKTGTGTTIYGSATIAYTQSSNNTKGYNEKLAGGTAPELLLYKSNTTWTISGIKTGGAKEMTLSFLSNKTTFSVTVSSANLTVSGSSKSWTISLATGKTDPGTFSITIKNTGSSNARIDNVELKVKTAGSGGSDPAITTTSSMTAFGYNMSTGVPTKQSFTVSGSNLTNNVSVTPPTGYEICLTENGTYQDEAIELSKGSGTLSATTIYVRLQSGISAGNYSGNIACSSTGATTQNVAVSGSVPFKVTWSTPDDATYATTYVAYATSPGTELGTLPSNPSTTCGGRSFYGWYDGESYTHATDAPAVVSASTKITSNKTYVAVFATSTGTPETWTKVTSAPSNWSGDYIITNAGGSNAMISDFHSGSSGEFKSSSVTISGSNITSTPTNKMIWTFAKNGNNAQYSLKNKSTGTYAKITGTSSTNAALDANAVWFTISCSSGTCIISSVTYSTRAFAWYSSNSTFRTYSNSGNTYCNLYKKSGGTTYSDFTTVCAACAADPTEGSAALKGGFSLSSVGVTATGWDAGTNCSWTDYGFVWGTSANPTVSDNKVPVGNSGTTTTWDGTLTGSFTVGTTYYFRAYGKNGKDGGAVQYSDDATFTPRQVSFNMHGHGGDAPANQVVNNGGKATDPGDPSEAGWTFGGWYNNDSYTGSAWVFGTNTVSGGNVTLHAKWTEKPKYTITLNAGNGTVSEAGWEKDGDVWKQQQSNGDASITFPSASSNCAGWEFVGWATSAANNVSSDPTSKAAGATLVPASNVTYYAVYRQNATGGTTYNKITSTGDLTTGDYLIVSTANYAMLNETSGERMKEQDGYTATNTSFATSSTDRIWTIIKFGSQVAIKNGSNFLGIDGDNNISLTTTPQFFTYTYNTTQERWEFTSVTNSSYQLIYGGSPNYFRMGTSQGSYVIYLYKQGAGLTGNYYTNPTCSDLSITGVADPAAGGSVTLSATSAKSGEKVYAYYTEDPAYRFNSWSVSGTGASISSTTAKFTEITVGSADVTLTANFDARVMYSVTWKANGEELTGVDLGSASTSVETGEKITNLPPNPSSCDGTSTAFVGWIAESEIWSGPTDDVSAKHIYTAASEIPAVTGAVTYHAVWAQVDSENASWKKVTSVDDLQDGETVAFISAGDGYYLPNAGSASGNAPSATAVTLTAGKINFVNAMKFTAIYNSEYDGFSFESVSESGKYLWVYDNNKGIYISATDENKSNSSNIWYLEDFDDANSTSTGYGIGMYATTGTGNYRYLTTYGTSDWRSYKSTSVGTGTPANLLANIYRYADAYKQYLVKCCNTPTLAFAASPYSTIRQDINGASTTTWAVVDVTFTSNSTGTISAAQYSNATVTNGTAYQLAASKWQVYETTGGTLCGASHAYFEVLTQPSGETPGTGKFHVKTAAGQTGQGTYRIAITQAATDESHGNFCETTVYGFVDVTLRDKFVDNVNGNGTINRDGHGAQLATPTLSEFGTQDEDACHSEGRKLKGWIKETDLKAQYETGSSTRVQTVDGLCETCANGTDQTSLIVAPGANVTMSGATWYAVWAYEK